MIDAIGGRDVAPEHDVFVIERVDHRRGIEGETAAQLRQLRPQAVAHQEGAAVVAAGSHNKGLRFDPQAYRGRAAGRPVDHRGLQRGDAATVHRQHVGANIRVQPGSERERRRNVGDQLALLRFVHAPLHAMAGFLAVVPGLGHPVAPPSEFQRAVAHQLVHAVEEFILGGMNVQRPADLIPGRAEIVGAVPGDTVAVRPELQAIGWRTVAVRPIVDRRAADIVTREQHRGIVGRGLQAAVVRQLGVHVELILVEGARRVVSTPLQDHDVAARVGQALRHRGAAAAGADHAHFGAHRLRFRKILVFVDPPRHCRAVS